MMVGQSDRYTYMSELRTERERDQSKDPVGDQTQDLLITNQALLLGPRVAVERKLESAGIYRYE